jgi:hypothetical protein
MTDQHHAAAEPTEPRHLHVHLGHQRTGGVEHLEPAPRRFLAHRLRHAVGAEDQRGAIGHLGQILDEDRPGSAQAIDHVTVVHDLVAHVDRRAEGFQRALDDGDGAIHAGAEAARIGKQDVHDAIIARPCACARRASRTRTAPPRPR